MNQYEVLVDNYVYKRYGKRNIQSKRRANELGTLGATEFLLKDESKIIVYFHYQLEKVCVLGEPYWI